MKGSMPAPRLPDVVFGKGDALERFMGDYLVGMFDDAAPLDLAPVVERADRLIFEWRGMAVWLMRLPPGGVMHAAEVVDTVELDLLAPVARSVNGLPVELGPAVGAQAVRVAAGVVCQRQAGPHGAAWLQFRGAA
jgi:hypothetical protein